MYCSHIRIRRTSHEAPPTTLLVTLMTIAAVFGMFGVCSSRAEQRSGVGILKGQVGVAKSDGVVSAESATVYIMFSSPIEAGSFSHVSNVDTAGGQFRHHLNYLLGKKKELKTLQNSARQNPGSDAAEQIAAFYLQSVDEALTQVRSWLTKHSDRTWQMKTVAPDKKGFWSAEDLPAGGYEVVVRGKVSGYEADWEAAVDLAPGRTISLPLTRPRFLRH